jgi:hypothetical protein
MVEGVATLSQAVSNGNFPENQGIMPNVGGVATYQFRRTSPVLDFSKRFDRNLHPLRQEVTEGPVHW